MSRTSHKLVRLDSLQPHPQNTEIYQDDQRTDRENDDLRSSITEHGLWEGHLLIHGQTNTILHGHRRVSLALELGIEEAVVAMQTHLPDDISDPEVLQFLLNGNATREKTNVERLREFELRKEVKKQLAARRSKAGKSIEVPPGQKGLGVETGQARDIAAREAGLTSATRGGKKAEEALKALKTADKLQKSEPDKAQAIKKALNDSLGSGVRVAKTLTVEPVDVPVKPSMATAVPSTMKFTNSTKRASGIEMVGGKRVRNIHRCKKVEGYREELEYFKEEMPKMLEKIGVAERQLRKMGDHLRKGWEHDRAYAEYMTVWATAWGEEEDFDFLEKLKKLNDAASLLQGALTGFNRFACTDEVVIDREEP